MRKLLTIAALSLCIGSTSLAQWSIFAGGGANMTTDCRKGANLGSVVNLNPPYQREWYITKGFGGGGGIGCSYLLKKHHLFLLKLTCNSQVINGEFGKALSTGDPHDPNYSSNHSYYISYDPMHVHVNSMLIPICYGYSFNTKNSFFSFIPYVGWINQFEFDGFYIGSIMGGIRLKIKCFYFDCFYGRSLTKYNDEFSTIHLQTVNLSLGYVYTFKTKAERQKTKK